jgi:hypothetical protein
MSTKIKSKWDKIDAAIQYYIDLGIQPNVYQNHEIFELYPIEYKNNYKVHDKNVFSKKLIWYEITFTYPDKDISRVQKSINRLKKYSKYNSIHGRFEIGKEDGLYHMHFLVKTFAYLRVSKVYEINNKKRIHVKKLEKVEDKCRFRNYIEKDVGKESDPEWVKFNFDDVL